MKERVFADQINRNAWGPWGRRLHGFPVAVSMVFTVGSLAVVGTLAALRWECLGAYSWGVGCSACSF